MSKFLVAKLVYTMDLVALTPFRDVLTLKILKRLKTPPTAAKDKAVGQSDCDF